MQALVLLHCEEDKGDGRGFVDGGSGYYGYELASYSHRHSQSFVSSPSPLPSLHFPCPMLQPRCLSFSFFFFVFRMFGKCSRPVGIRGVLHFRPWLMMVPGSLLIFGAAAAHRSCRLGNSIWLKILRKQETRK